MGRKQTTNNIPENKMIEYQRQLANFLKSYRTKQGLLAKDLAEELGYTPARYGQLESETNPQTRFASSLEFLYTISSLEDKSISEFIIFLEGEEDRLSDKGTLKRELYQWEHKALKSLDSINRDLRDGYIDFLSNLTISKRELILSLCILAARLDNKVIQKFIDLFEELTPE